jgi:hypothetical protein
MRSEKEKQHVIFIERHQMRVLEKLIKDGRSDLLQMATIFPESVFSVLSATTANIAYLQHS